MMNSEQMSAYRAIKPSERPVTVLLDLDGTLLQTDKLMSHIFKEMEAALNTQLQQQGEPPLSEHELQRLYSAYRKRTSGQIFSPKGLLEFFESSLPKSAATRFDSLHQLLDQGVATNGRWHIFPGASPALQELVQQETELGVFTEGEEKWQGDKLESMRGSGGNQLMSDQSARMPDVPLPAQLFKKELQFISPNKTSSHYLFEVAMKLLSSGCKQVVVVDDSQAVLDRVRKNWPYNLMPEESLLLVLVDKQSAEESHGDSPSSINNAKVETISSLQELPSKIAKILVGLRPHQSPGFDTPQPQH